MPRIRDDATVAHTVSNLLLHHHHRSFLLLSLLLILTTIRPSHPFATTVPLFGGSKHRPSSVPPRSAPAAREAENESWSRTAHLPPKDPDAAVSDDDDEDGNLPLLEGILTTTETVVGDDGLEVEYDLSSPRKWMEYLDATEGRWSMEGGYGGAYTVCRCDLKPSSGAVEGGGSSRDERCLVWGEGFHLDRLQSSYAAMMKATAGDTNEDLGYEEAVRRSRTTIRSLVREASAELDRRHAAIPPGDLPPSGTVVAMVTLFWTPNDRTGIDVRGHILVADTTSCSPPENYNPKPVHVTIALPPPSSSASRDKVHGDITLRLPSRYDRLPDAKLSSWCTDRRPLETTLYKPSFASEVILVRPPLPTSPPSSGRYGDSHELLEGLTSNLFLLYDDGTLRTAPPSDVLRGYARESVLAAAERCGVPVMTDGGVALGDGRRGRWVDAFVTSAVRVVVPLDGIWVPEYGGDGGTEVVEWKEVWKRGEGRDGGVWRTLHDDIVNHVLYRGGRDGSAKE